MRFIVSLAFCLGMINLTTVLSDEKNEIPGTAMTTIETTQLHPTNRSSQSMEQTTNNSVSQSKTGIQPTSPLTSTVHNSSTMSSGSRSPSVNSAYPATTNTTVSTTNSTDQEQTTVSAEGGTNPPTQETTAENEGTSFVPTSPLTYCNCSLLVVTTEIAHTSPESESVDTTETTRTSSESGGSKAVDTHGENTPTTSGIPSTTSGITYNTTGLTSNTTGIKSTTPGSPTHSTTHSKGDNGSSTHGQDTTTTPPVTGSSSSVANQGSGDSSSKRKALSLHAFRVKRDTNNSEITTFESATTVKNRNYSTSTTSNVQSSDSTDSYTFDGDEHCRLYCLNEKETSASVLATNPLTSPHTSTTTLATSTQKYPKQKPKWDKLKFNVTLEIEVSVEFNDSLSNKSSSLYQQYEIAFKVELAKKYNSTPGFLGIKIIEFRNGSVIAKYEVLLDLEKADTGIGNIETVIRSISNNWTDAHIPGVGDIDANATKQLQTKRLATEFVGCKFKAEICPQAEYSCKGDKFGKEECVYNCVNNDHCRNNGECYVQFDGKSKCHCVDSETHVYYGDNCEHGEPKINPSKVKKEKNVIIYIASGVGGGAVLILFLILACVCYKWRKDKKKLSEDVLDGASNLSIENYKIENIPVQGFGRDNPTFADERNSVRMQSISSRYDQDRRGDSRGKMNPIFHDDTSDMRKGSGNEYTSMPDDHYYKSLDHDKSDKPAMMYQPSNIRKPIQRDSNTSTGDHMTVNPLPLDTADDMNSRMTFYDRLDTKQEYKIKRPNIRSKAVDY